MPTIIATIGAANANSYETQAEANTYFDERVPITPPWVSSGDASIRALIMATRVLDMFAQPVKIYVPGSGGNPGYNFVRRQWTGAPASATQRLAWPRTGMFDRNGNAILSNVIPRELKEAESELAGQLLIEDTTLNLDQVVQGVSSVSAGSVSVSFKDTIIPQKLPDAVLNLMPPSWFTDDVIEGTSSMEFEVL